MEFPLRKRLKVDRTRRVATCHLHQLMNEGIPAFTLVRLTGQLDGKHTGWG